MIDFRNSDPGEPLSLETMRRAVESGSFTSLEGLQAFMDQQMAHYNDQPQDELGGLSPLQMHRLLCGDWLTSGPLRLSSNLTLAEAQGADFLVNARQFLDTTKAENGVRATTAGNLNRKFVTAMLEQMRWPEGFVAHVHRWNRVINEDDVFPLHILRVVLTVARCVRLTKGRFRATSVGKDLAKESNAAALYVLLFRTFFREFNLAYLDGSHENPGLQHTIAYSCYRLSTVAADWCDPAALTDRVLLDPVRELPEHPYLQNEATWQLRSRIVRPLIWFGLLERRDLPATEPWREEFEIRKSPLFDRLLRFQFNE
ncbi:MAG: hypothetical protein AMS18_02140 [Gemmatimonas sp. SG8_17]|nr:MAG: hypothetical protein AMS18_02140 [Gemmatimonas sp. SG8_17]